MTSFLIRIYRFKLYYQYSAPLSDKDIAYAKICRGPISYYYLLRGLINGYFVKKVLQKASIVFPISSFHKNSLTKLCIQDKLVPLTMGVDQNWIDAPKRTILYLEEIKKTKFLVTYFGTLNFSRDPKFILRVFSEIKKRCKSCKLLLMGKTATQWEKNQLKLICKNLGISQDVIFTGQLDPHKLRDHLNYCDVSISAIPLDSFFINSSPTKLYESLGVGVPVVANNGIYEQEKVITESGGGVLVDYDEISFAEGVVELLKNAEKRNKMGENGKNYVNHHYTYKAIAKKILPYF